MSILVDKLRAVLFSNLRTDMPKPIRVAAWDLFTAVDSDLDVAGYTGNESSTTQDTADRFDAVLKSAEQEDVEFIFEEEEEEEAPQKDVLDTELDDDED